MLTLDTEKTCYVDARTGAQEKEMKKISICFLLVFVSILSLWAKKVEYRAVSFSESGFGYSVNVSYPIFGNDLEVINRKIAEIIECDVDYLTRSCQLDFLYEMYSLHSWYADVDLEKKFDSLRYKASDSSDNSKSYKKWLMSSRGLSAINLLKKKANEVSEELSFYNDHEGVVWRTNFEMIIDKNLLQIVFDNTYPGGAHNLYEILTINYDLEKGTFVTLDEVTGLSMETIESTLEKSGFGSFDSSQVYNRYFPFVRQNRIIRIYFAPGEIAGMAAGNQEVLFDPKGLNAWQLGR